MVRRSQTITKSAVSLQSQTMAKQCLITHLGQRKFSKVRCLRNVRLELIYIMKLNKQNIPATQMVVFLFTLISFISALLILPNFAALSVQISVKPLPIFAQLFTFLFLALKSMLFLVVRTSVERGTAGSFAIIKPSESDKPLVTCKA